MFDPSTHLRPSLSLGCSFLRGAAALSLLFGVSCSSSSTDEGTGGSNSASGSPGGAGTPAGVAGASSAGSPAGGGEVSSGGASTAGASSMGGAGPGHAGASSLGGGASGGANASGAGGANVGGASAGGGGAHAGGASVGGAGGGSAAAGSGSGGASSTGGKSMGCGAMRTLKDGSQTIQSGGTQRTYTLRVPTDYKNDTAYRLVLSFHGAGGSSRDVAPSYFGLWDLAQGTTIFAAPDAAGDKTWKPASDTPLVQDMIKQISGDLCIDTSRIVIEGFSHGGAFTWTLACALPGVFQAAVVHSGGGLGLPQTCKPIPFFSALGTDGSGQGMSSDYFAKVNGCTVESLPMAPTGGHTCTNYKNCMPGYPTRWCDYDAGHTPSAVDQGQTKSWVPQEVWTFLTQL